MTIAFEIEYKYLCPYLTLWILHDNYDVVSSNFISQYYLPDGTRLRKTTLIDNSDEKYFITKKTPTDDPRVWIEDERFVTKDEYLENWREGLPSIHKIRAKVLYENNVWEVDFYDGLDGLTTAELEVPSIDYEFKIPSFCTQDVTADVAYKNYNLAKIGTTYE
jgi:CYTH domain-containing protein